MAEFTPVELSIRDRLSILEEAELEVRLLPNKSNEKGKIEGNGAITISWAKDELSVPVALGEELSQDCKMLFALEIRLKNLRDVTGGSTVRGAIYQRLLGFSPPHCGRMYCKSYEFVSRKESVWTYEAMWIAPTLLQQQEEDVNLPLLKSIFLCEEINTVPIAEPYPLIEDGS